MEIYLLGVVMSLIISVLSLHHSTDKYCKLQVPTCIAAILIISIGSFASILAGLALDIYDKLHKPA